MTGTIAEIARLTHVPAGTIRRWLAEGRLVRHSDAKPYRVNLDEVLTLRVLLAKSGPREQSCCCTRRPAPESWGCGPSA